MARVANLHEDDETQLSQAPEAAAPMAGSAQVPVGGTGGATAAAPAPRQGRFQDINRLLYANQGQGQAVAQQAIGAAQGKADTAQSQLNTAKGAYQAQAQQPAVTQQAVVAQPQPPVVQGAGGLRGSRATTQVNVAPDYGTLEQQAAATYTGPRNFNETKGVDQAALQGAFTDAQRAASSLTQPAGVSALLGRTGGAGAFDNLLAQHEAGGALHAAGGRLGGIRSMLDAAIRDTAPADAARAATEKAATSAQAALAARDRGAQETMNRQTEATNAQAADDEAYRQWMSTGGGGNAYMPTTANVNFEDDASTREYFENNKAEIDAFINGYGGAQSYDAVRKYRREHGRPSNAQG